MNFAYGVIVVVGVLAAIVLGLIAASPDDIIEPRIIPVEEKPTACTMQWDPMCGVDGETYGNLCMLDAADVKLNYSGECMAAEPETISVIELEETIEISESTPISEPEPEMSSETLLSSFTVSTAEGSGGPGCEETNECFLPYEITVAVGATVTWSNDDAAAHTVTSGTISDGVDGLFDSSLFMSGTTFEFTFDDVGDYDYFCMVHPWMTGIVHVN